MDSRCFVVFLELLEMLFQWKCMSLCFFWPLQGENTGYIYLVYICEGPERKLRGVRMSWMSIFTLRKERQADIFIRMRTFRSRSLSGVKIRVNSAVHAKVFRVFWECCRSKIAIPVCHRAGAIDREYGYGSATAAIP